MPYLDRYKANTDIFENIYIKTDDVIFLSGILPNKIDSEASLFAMNNQGESIKKYLPSMYVNDSEEAKTKLNELITGQILKQSITFCIRLAERPFPVGYVVCESPISGSCLGDWSISFCIAEPLRQKKLTSKAVYYTLKHLQKMEVPVVKALVDIDNTNSIKLLENLGFGKESIENGGKRFVYRVDLN